MPLLDELIDANRRATPLREAPAGAAAAQRQLCVITCVDPRLGDLLLSALGLASGDAVFIRLPGTNVLTGKGDALREVAAAVYLYGAKEVLLLGHTDCAESKLDASAISSRMQAAGLSPSAMPGGPRDFLGGFGDPRQVVAQGAAALRAAPFLPRDLLIHAAVLDTRTGALEVVERGESHMNQDRVSDGDGLDYRPGPNLAMPSPLGGGEAILAASTHSLLSGSGALALSTNPFAATQVEGLISAVPPGWGDGTGALAPTPIAQAGFSALDQVAVAAAPVASTIDLGFKPMDLSPRAAPAPQASPPSSARREKQRGHGGQKGQQAQQGRPAKQNQPKQPQQQQARPARVQTVNVSDAKARGNIEAVRAFYRAEFESDARRKVGKALAEALNAGKTADDLCKLAIKPILDTGQKRYRVIDELIAMKEYVVGLPADEAYEVLRQLLE